MKGFLFSFILYLLPVSSANALPTDTLYLTNQSQIQKLGTFIEYYFEKDKGFSVLDAYKENHFEKSNKSVPNLGTSSDTLWVTFTAINKGSNTNFNLVFEDPTLNFIGLYRYVQDSLFSLGNSRLGGNPQHNLEFNHSFIFNLHIRPQEQVRYFLKIYTNKQIILPILLGTKDQVEVKNEVENILFSIFIGIILSMLFYNLFLYLTVKESVYLYYVVYIFIVGLTQLSISGFSATFLWSTHSWIEKQCFFLLTPMVNLSGILFVQKFLELNHFSKFLYKVGNGFILLFCFAIIVSLSNNFHLAYLLEEILVLPVPLYILGSNIYVNSKGLKSGKYFLVAWSFLLLSIFLFLMSYLGVIPYGYFTKFTIMVGSSIEVTLLSIALADKINTYKKEKEESQAMALRVSQENEQMIKEQNITLENKVKERTMALETSNHNLNNALDTLKGAQAQLVDAEKMASLGQLTAGIAHEINNPINFVQSNIHPLQLDIEDLKEVIQMYDEIEDDGNIQEKLVKIKLYKREIDLDYIKTEIDSLIKGIEEGAVRTSEIVKGLRTFSRLDESELKLANIQDGIDSTLTLLRNSMPEYISVEKNYGDLPMIECYPGKLNQVFMNILNNAIYAIKEKPDHGQEKITISTWVDPDLQNMEISISDTGMGIPEEVKEKIFEPFFTTKDVGQGTGLGLSIVFSIIEKHKGKIIVHSTFRKGSEFIISLPITKGTDQPDETISSN